MLGLIKLNHHLLGNLISSSFHGRTRDSRDLFHIQIQIFNIHPLYSQDYSKKLWLQIFQSLYKRLLPQVTHKQRKYHSSILIINKMKKKDTSFNQSYGIDQNKNKKYPKFQGIIFIGWLQVQDNVHCKTNSTIKRQCTLLNSFRLRRRLQRYYLDII